MSVRKQYELTKEDSDKLMASCRPAAASSSIIAAWEDLGKRLGFDYKTVEPVHYKVPLCFTAMSTEPAGDQNEAGNEAG